MDRKLTLSKIVSTKGLLYKTFSLWYCSSDDELAVEGLKCQKQDAESSSEDEFEKEMDMELECVMRTYENNQGRSDVYAFN